MKWASAVATGLVVIAWVTSYFKSWDVFIGVEYTAKSEPSDEYWFRELRHVALTGESERFVVRWPYGVTGTHDLIFKEDVPEKPPQRPFVECGLKSPSSWADWTAWNPWNRSIGGLGWFRTIPPPCGTSYTCIAMPYYVALPLVAAPFACAVRRPVFSKGAGRCGACGYSLVGLFAVSHCPECGTRAELRS